MEPRLMIWVGFGFFVALRQIMHHPGTLKLELCKAILRSCQTQDWVSPSMYCNLRAWVQLPQAFA